MRYSCLFILPVYNEEEVLEKSVTTLHKYLEKLEFKPWAIVIADNGSTDETSNIIKKMTLKFPKEVLCFKAAKKGRGVALKEAVENYDAEVYSYFDIDLPLMEDDIVNFVNSVKNNSADIQIVKRKGKRPFYRNLMSRLYGFLVKALLDIDFNDSQCGAKCFNQAVALSVIPKCVQEGYYFDTEFISIAHKNHFRINEKELFWIENRFTERKSKVNIIRDSFNAFINIFKIAFSVNKTSSIHSLLVFVLSAVYILLFFLETLLFPIFTAKMGPFYIPPNLLSFEIILVLWSVIYFLVLKKIQPRYLDKLIIYISFGVVALFALMTFPIYSQDQNWNLLMSKGFVRYGINPYLTPLGKIPINSWFTFVPHWHTFTMTHGPLSIYLFSVPVLLSDNFYYALLIIKLISLFSLIVCFILFTKIMLLSGVEKPVVDKNIYFLLLNPFLIINSVISVHNDIFVGVTVLLFVFFLLKRRYILSLLMLFIGTLIKYIPIILMPLLLYRIWDDKKLTLKEKVFNTASGLLLGAILSFLLYLPFLAGSKNLISLFAGLLRQSTFDSSNLVVFTSYIPYIFGLNGPYLRVLSLISATIISIYLVYKRKIIESVYAALIIPVFFGNMWFQPWYLLWSYFLMLKKELSYDLLLLTIFLVLCIANGSVLYTSIYVFAIFLSILLLKKFIKAVNSKPTTDKYPAV